MVAAIMMTSGNYARNIDLDDVDHREDLIELVSTSIVILFNDFEEAKEHFEMQDKEVKFIEPEED